MPAKRASPNVLLTGFEPFEQELLNPSWEAVRSLDGWKCGRATVHARLVPCVFGEALTALDRAMDELQPTLVICIGQAGGRAEFTPERIAINVDDARVPDNLGRQPIDAPVVPGAPAAYFSSLPVKAIVRELRAGGVPASVSNSAGTFVCNHLFYGLMHRIATHAAAKGARGGFIHIPYLPAQAARFPGAPSMSLETLVDALRITVKTALAVKQDVAETGGQLH
ncbi:Pyrrolidone-carboxylate peptidase [Variovorax boronicumulans]|uniref:pyroglutamyl-peptidase I n=1 Tax=Variovorax boronicumulans TaxID=436515 RepID=UPI000BB366FC|nr:pyroglutamyl-peptidase I [Variovorax boronicumulans]PBI87671.1 Pyrrolidone-carboxylate peptidase [Variovorax boronicumulans]